MPWSRPCSFRDGSVTGAGADAPCWGIAHAVLPSSPQANNEPPPPPVAFCACPSVIPDSPPRYSGYSGLVLPRARASMHARPSSQAGVATGTGRQQRSSIYPSLSYAHYSHSLVSCTPPLPAWSFLFFRSVPLPASLRCQIYLSTVPQSTAALTMAAAARLLLLRVLALLAAAQAVVGKSAVLSLRELDGRRGASTETRGSRYADAKLVEMLGTARTVLVLSQLCVTETLHAFGIQSMK